MKSFREFIAESKLKLPRRPSKEDVKGLSDFMANRYMEVAPDLPRHGNYHFDSAVGHLGDYAHDEVSAKHYGRVPKGIDLHKIAKSVVKRYADDDTRESKANEKRREKMRLSSLRSKKASSINVKKEKRWDDRAPPPKSRRGAGSL